MTHRLTKMAYASTVPITYVRWWRNAEHNSTLWCCLSMRKTTPSTTHWGCSAPASSSLATSKSPTTPSMKSRWVSRKNMVFQNILFSISSATSNPVFVLSSSEKSCKKVFGLCRKLGNGKVWQQGDAQTIQTHMGAILSTRCAWIITMPTTIYWLNSGGQSKYNENIINYL